VRDARQAVDGDVVRHPGDEVDVVDDLALLSTALLVPHLGNGWMALSHKGRGVK
jgi:hypothetical protein